MVEIFGNEDATLRVDAKHVTRFRAGGVEANDTVAAGPARLEQAHAVAPGDFGIGDRRAGLALSQPEQAGADPQRARLLGHQLDGGEHPGLGGGEGEHEAVAQALKRKEAGQQAMLDAIRITVKELS